MFIYMRFKNLHIFAEKREDMTRIKDVLKEKNMTIRDLSILLNKNYQGTKELCSRDSINISTLQNIAHVLNVPIITLLYNNKQLQDFCNMKTAPAFFASVFFDNKVKTYIDIKEYVKDTKKFIEEHNI